MKKLFQKIPKNGKFSQIFTLGWVVRKMKIMNVTKTNTDKADVGCKLGNFTLVLFSIHSILF